MALKILAPALPSDSTVRSRFIAMRFVQGGDLRRASAVNRRLSLRQDRKINHFPTSVVGGCGDAGTPETPFRAISPQLTPDAS